MPSLKACSVSSSRRIVSNARSQRKRASRACFRRLTLEQFEARQLLAADGLANEFPVAIDGLGPISNQELTSLKKISSNAFDSNDLGAHSVEEDPHHDELRHQGHDHEEHKELEIVATNQFSYQFTSYGDFVTETSEAQPLDIAREFLSTELSKLGFHQSDLEDVVVTDMYQSNHNGVTHIYFQQRYQGLPIANALANVNVTLDGQVASANSAFVPLGGQETENGAVDYRFSNPYQFELSARDVSHIHEGGLSKTQSMQSWQIDPRLSADQALVRLSDFFDWEGAESPSVVEQELGPANRGARQTLSPSGVSDQPIQAELQYVAGEEGLELAWRLNVRRIFDGHWYDALVSSSSGNLLDLSDWASHATYNVYELPSEGPDDSSRSLAIDPQDTTASPFGWHDTDGVAGAEFTITRGNNTYVSADRNGDLVPDPGSSPDGGAALVFDNPIDLTQAPVTYQAASATNLFYTTNVLHDVFYQYGFDELAGNFQANNYGKGGLEADEILAFVQARAEGGPNGPEVDNAGFFAPPDGENAVALYLEFAQTSPRRDSSLNSEIIIHEVTHGLTERLIAGPSNASALEGWQSGGMGEGWSDWMSLMLTQKTSDSANAGIGYGTYLLGQGSNGSGFRTQQYSFNMSINDLTYADVIGNFSVHGIGEIWAVTLWDLNWALIEGNSLDARFPNAGLGFDSDLVDGTGGNNLTMQLVIDAMKLMGAEPSFLDARDALLTADTILTGGAYQQTIWEVFARRGMGFSADDGGNANALEVTEAFDVPATSNAVIVFDDINPLEGSFVEVTLRDSDLSTTQSLQVTSSGGDAETISLESIGVLGVFTGALDTGAGTPSSGDGVLQVNAGDTVSITYVDADDGAGMTNVSKTAQATIGTRVASPLFPSATPGFLTGVSPNFADVRSAADIEPFTFFAEAGELITIHATPFNDAIVQVEIEGLIPRTQSPSAGEAAVADTVEIQADGNYKLLVSADMPVSPQVFIGRNTIVEESVGDAEDGNELVLDSSGLRVGNGSRYAASAVSIPITEGIVNGGFETGDFSGWEVQAFGNVFNPWTVSEAGAGSGFGLDPTSPQRRVFCRLERLRRCWLHRVLDDSEHSSASRPRHVELARSHPVGLCFPNGKRGDGES